MNANKTNTKQLFGAEKLSGLLRNRSPGAMASGILSAKEDSSKPSS